MSNEIEKISTELRQAVTDIKAAILQGQYEACKGVNRIQLAVYFGIGKYIPIGLEHKKRNPSLQEEGGNSQK